MRQTLIRGIVLAAGFAVLHSTALPAQTRFARSPDGTRIAYEVSGDPARPVIMLLHGGGQSRAVWSAYIARLQSEFRVIAVDQRGSGESDKPTDSSSYAIHRLVDDILTVADSAGAPRFSIWGFSYGANIGRYVALRSPRVESMVYIGIPFGPSVGGTFLTTVDQMRAKWNPHIEAQKAGRLDLNALAPEDRAAWQRSSVPLLMAWLSAMLGYPPVEPAAMRVPTLWVVGSANQGAMESVALYRDRLAGTQVTLAVFEGLNHPQELERIDTVFPREVEFTRAAVRRDR